MKQVIKREDSTETLYLDQINSEYFYVRVELNKKRILNRLDTDAYQWDDIYQLVKSTKTKVATTRIVCNFETAILDSINHGFKVYQFSSVRDAMHFMLER